MTGSPHPVSASMSTVEQAAEVSVSLDSLLSTRPAIAPITTRTSTPPTRPGTRYLRHGSVVRVRCGGSAPGGAGGGGRSLTCGLYVSLERTRLTVGQRGTASPRRTASRRRNPHSLGILGWTFGGVAPQIARLCSRLPDARIAVMAVIERIGKPES